MPDMDGKKKLEELVAGLDGVTPGPWGWVVHDHSMASMGVLPDPGLSDPLVLCVSPCKSCQERADPKEWEWNRCHTPTEADAAHLARCDPDTIRSISEAFNALEAERDALRSLVSLAHPVMRECGWHNAVEAEPQSDGVLEAACTEVEAKFSASLSEAEEGRK